MLPVEPFNKVDVSHSSDLLTYLLTFRSDYEYEIECDYESSLLYVVVQ